MVDRPVKPAVLAIGGSAGSVPPLIELIAGLPAELPAAVLVTIHIGERTRSSLPEILGRAGRFPVGHPRDGDPIENGRVYVAPPGRHLVVQDGGVTLSAGPRVNRHRPAVDVLFASTAEWAQNRTVAVVLSGVLDDGAVGAALVDLAGGHVLVQAPQEAEFEGMPAAALAATPRARSIATDDLAPSVVEAVRRATADDGRRRREGATMEATMTMAESDDPGFLSEAESRLTRLSCPDCGGGMAQVDLPQISYFRCHIGHQFAPQALAAAQEEVTETKLWSAVTALEEQAVVLRYLQRTGSTEAESEAAAARRAAEIARRAVALREQIRSWTPAPNEADRVS